MTACPLHVPALRDALQLADVESAHLFTPIEVTRWGRVGGFTFRVGDQIVLGPVGTSDLLVLRPSGYGFPMLGRRRSGRLLAEPGLAPASPRRWSPEASVVAVQRSPDRVVADAGSWWVTVVIHGELTDADLARVQGGQLRGAELDALAKRAAAVSRDTGVGISIGAAIEPSEASTLAHSCPAGAVWLQPDRPPVAGELETPQDAQVIAGPWRAASAREVEAPGSLQLSLFSMRSAHAS